MNQLNEDTIQHIKKEALTNMKQGVPTLVFTMIAAVLIWVFGNLAFMPLAEGISLYEWPLDKIISLIILIALMAVIVKSIISLTKIVDGISSFAAIEMNKLQKNFDEKSLRRYRSFLRGIVFSIMIILVFILIQDYLTQIHPALSGILLMVIVIWSIYLLYQGGTKISGEITRAITDLGKDAVKVAKEEEIEEKKVVEKTTKFPPTKNK